MKHTSKKPSNLSDSLQQRLNSYALAASAAGVGMLTLAQPSEAKVVYTQAHKVLHYYGEVDIDLNHDGISDFRLYCGVVSGANARFLHATALQSSNAMWGTFGFASALSAGRQIGSGRPLYIATSPAHFPFFKGASPPFFRNSTKDG